MGPVKGCGWVLIYVTNDFYRVLGVFKILHDDYESCMIYGSKGISKIYVC